MLDHIITINADKYTATDDEGIVTGKYFIIIIIHTYRLYFISWNYSMCRIIASS